MKIVSIEIDLKTKGNCDIVDITEQIQAELDKHSICNGMVNVFVPGSTASVTTIEYESGALQDLKDAIERMAPERMHYYHDEKWRDGNGHSHVRASIFGPNITVPVKEGKLNLGTWQQMILLDFDNRPRQRWISVQIIGE